MPTPEELRKLYAQLIAKAWSDSAFKDRLVREPVAVLREYGVEAPSGVEIEVVENSDRVVHIVLPPSLGQEGAAEAAGGSQPSRFSVNAGLGIEALVADAVSDPSIKERLLREPESVARSYGIDIPDGADVRVIQSTGNRLYYVLPQPPRDELSEEVLELVAAGRRVPGGNDKEEEDDSEESSCFSSSFPMPCSL